MTQVLRLRTLISWELAVFALLAGCSKPSASPARQASEAAAPSGPVLKVAVLSDGRLTVEGATATLQSLRDSLHRLSAQHGVVWYYREAPQDSPPPIAMLVMQEIVESQVPLRLSSRPDYSDTVVANPPPRPAQ